MNRRNNKHKKSSRSPGPYCKFWAEAKLNNILYFVYTWSVVCTVQLINTWRQAGLNRDLLTIRKTEDIARPEAPDTLQELV
jgi:hypothetical protein